MKDRNITLDLLKLFSAYAIVFLHLIVRDTMGMSVNAVTRFAVPLFFTISGYFLYNNNPKKILSKFYHIFYIFIGTFILYFSYEIIKLYLLGDTVSLYNFLKYLFDKKQLILFVIFNCTTGIFGHLWYLPAIMYCYIIYYFINKTKIDYKICYIFAFILIIIQLILGELLSVFDIRLRLYLIRNFLLVGFPFVTLGIFIKEIIVKKNQIVLKIPNYILYLLLIMGLIESLFVTFKFNCNELYLGSILIAFALFVLALKGKDRKYNNKIINLSKCSTIIYVLHIFIDDLITTVLQKLNFKFHGNLFDFLKAIVVCIVCTVVALMVNYLSNKQKINK